jgi:hypothetical protein
MRPSVFLLSLVAAGVFAATAAATPPLVQHFSFTEFPPSTLSGVCSFDVVVSSDLLTGTQTIYFDRSGAVTRAHVHVTWQDTFSANGKTITGVPYTANVQFLVDSSGNVTHAWATGPAERIRLPDGTMFVSAGRVDFTNHPDTPFLLSPDVGNPGNIAAFCAALA